MKEDHLRIVIADDHELFRSGVVNTFEATDDLEVVGAAGCVDEVLVLIDRLLPDIVLLDVSMPGGGVEAAGRIAADYPLIRIAMLTVSENEEDVSAALRAGASAYILKGIGGNELIETVRKIGAGETFITPSLATRLLSQSKDRESADGEDPFATLRYRESQVLRRVASGLSNREIGISLGLSEKTVKHYMTNVLQKLQVRNRVEAAIVARDHLDASRSV